MRRVGFSRNLSPCCFPMRFVSLGLCFALVSVNLALMRFGVRATTMRKNGFSSSAQSVRQRRAGEVPGQCLRERQE